MKNTDRKRLYEVMRRLDKTFKPKLNEAYGTPDPLGSNYAKPLNENPQKTFVLNLWGEDNEVYFQYNKYRDNNALAVELVETTGEPYAMISVNVPESAQLPEDEFFLKDWSENEPVAKALVEKGVIIPTGKRTSSGFIVAKSYKINPEYK